MKQFARRSVAFVSIVVRASCELLQGMFALLVGAPDPTREDDAVNNAVRGGELNHRTGQFDDGTDPGGWYERD